MAVNKVVFGAVAIMDITDSTVTKETLAEGVTAYDKSGEKIVGTLKSPVMQQKTVTPTTSQQNVTPDSGYDGLSKVTVNAMPTATQATPSITVSTGGLITAKATQSAGYVASGTKQATEQLTVQAAKTITPTTSNQTAVASGRYTTGEITVKGDANLKAENIAEGVSIFGVTGTHAGGEDLDSVITELETKVATLNTTLDGKASGGGSGTEVETCTVILMGISIALYSAFTYTNGAHGITWEFDNSSSLSLPITIKNVVCNSQLFINFSAVEHAAKITGDAELVVNSGGRMIFHITASQDETITIVLYDND